MIRTEFDPLDLLLMTLIATSTDETVDPGRLANEALARADPDVCAGWKIRLAAFDWFKTRAQQMIANPKPFMDRIAAQMAADAAAAERAASYRIGARHPI